MLAATLYFVVLVHVTVQATHRIICTDVHMTHRAAAARTQAIDERIKDVRLGLGGVNAGVGSGSSCPAVSGGGDQDQGHRGQHC